MRFTDFLQHKILLITTAQRILRLTLVIILVERHFERSGEIFKFTKKSDLKISPLTAFGRNDDYNLLNFCFCSTVIEYCFGNDTSFTARCNHDRFQYLLLSLRHVDFKRRTILCRIF